jgi:hypothetical protein
MSPYIDTRLLSRQVTLIWLLFGKHDFILSRKVGLSEKDYFCRKKKNSSASAISFSTLGKLGEDMHFQILRTYYLISELF